MNISNVTELVKNLKKSPTYNLTNSSMENSHTDFWGWLVQELGIDGLKIFGIVPIQMKNYLK